MGLFPINFNIAKTSVWSRTQLYKAKNRAGKHKGGAKDIQYCVDIHKAFEPISDFNSGNDPAITFYLDFSTTRISNSHNLFDTSNLTIEISNLSCKRKFPTEGRGRVTIPLPEGIHG